MFKIILELIKSFFAKREEVEEKEEMEEKRETVIYKLIGQLPKHPTKKWTTRALSAIDTIAVHQSVSLANDKKGVIEAINRYHINPNHISSTGLPAIAYHYVVLSDGIYQVNALTDVTAHAKGYNTRSIGILCPGDFSGPSYIGKEVPTKEQLDFLLDLINMLVEQFGIEKVVGHCDISTKENCPGTVISDTIKHYKN